MSQRKWVKRLVQVCWLLAGIGAVVLLGAAMQHKNQKRCVGVQVEIAGTEQEMFLDEKDILALLTIGKPVVGTPVAQLNLQLLERRMERNEWVKNAELFFDNQQVLQVSIEERQPLARVFTKQGRSFYFDSTGLRLPLSEKISARVPMFTNFPSDNIRLSKPDSALLEQMLGLATFIQSDSFWMAQIAQVDITPQGFELVPVIGEHVVVLGNAGDLKEKFSRLYTFYQQAWLQNGIHAYERLDVQYAHQIVAVRRGTAKARIDSAGAARAIQNLLEANALPVTDTATAVIIATPDNINNKKPLSIGQKYGPKAVLPKTTKRNN